MAQLNSTVASYNIHIGIGRDGQFLPDRTARVILELSADVIALQEVQLGPEGFNMLDHLETVTGFVSVPGPTLVHAVHGQYGNAVLTRHRVTSARSIDLSFDG